MESGNGVVAAPPKRVDKGVREERKIAENGLPRKHQWIAEAKVGPCRPRAVRVAGVNKDGSPQLRAIDLKEARRGFAAAVRDSRRRGVKAPVDERWGKLVDHSTGENGGGNATGGGKNDSKEKLPPGIYPGDVYLEGIPMIDQGRTAYCAVASAARVLQHYGIDMTMEDMAELAGASATGGTNIRLWDQALGKVARDHGLELKVIPELTETFTPLSQLMYDYNHMARDMGYAEVNTWDYLRPGVEDYRSFWRDREYPVMRELMLSDERKLDAFDENVIARINGYCRKVGDGILCLRSAA